MAAPLHPVRRGRAALWLPLLLSLLLVAAACSDDDGGDDEATSGEATPSTEAPADDGSDGDSSTTTSAADAGDGIGSVDVDGERYVLTEVTGITSCDLEDPDGSLTVAAEGDDVFLRLDHYGTDPASDEFSVAVGEVEYVSASAEDVAYTVEGQTISGTIPVEPLFEEGTAQDVTFEVTCP